MKTIKLQVSDNGLEGTPIDVYDDLSLDQIMHLPPLKFKEALIEYPTLPLTTPQTPNAIIEVLEEPVWQKSQKHTKKWHEAELQDYTAYNNFRNFTGWVEERGYETRLAYKVITPVSNSEKIYYKCIKPLNSFTVGKTYLDRGDGWFWNDEGGSHGISEPILEIYFEIVEDSEPKDHLRGIVKEILYYPVTNNQGEKSIDKGVELIRNWKAQQQQVSKSEDGPKPNAITYDQLLTLPWYWGVENGKEFTHLLKPGYDNIDGNTKYFGTSKDGKRIISVNADYVGHTYVLIEENGGTRRVFNGHVRSFEELKLINSLVL